VFHIRYERGEDPANWCLSFSQTRVQALPGTGSQEIEFVPGGKDIEVTRDNFPAYLRAKCEWNLGAGNLDCLQAFVQGVRVK
jgi:hypothetical protein